MKYIKVILALSVATASSAQAGVFTNLDFESANTNNIAGGPGNIYYGTTQDLTPGWTLKDKSGKEITTIFFNSETPGGIPFAILEVKDPNYPSVAFDGQYGLSLISTAMDPLFLSQTGTIPPDSKYINFTSHQHVSLSIDGNNVEINEVNVSRNNLEYRVWADINQYEVYPKRWTKNWEN